MMKLKRTNAPLMRWTEGGEACQAESAGRACETPTTTNELEIFKLVKYMVKQGYTTSQFELLAFLLREYVQATLAHL